MESDKLPQALDVMKSRWQENFVNRKLSSVSEAISSENTAAHCKRLGYFNCLTECATKSTPFVWLIKLLRNCTSLTRWTTSKSFAKVLSCFLVSWELTAGACISNSHFNKIRFEMLDNFENSTIAEVFLSKIKNKMQLKKFEVESFSRILTNKKFS